MWWRHRRTLFSDNADMEVNVRPSHIRRHSLDLWLLRIKLSLSREDLW